MHKNMRRVCHESRQNQQFHPKALSPLQLQTPPSSQDTPSDGLSSGHQGQPSAGWWCIIKALHLFSGIPIFISAFSVSAWLQPEASFILFLTSICVCVLSSDHFFTALLWRKFFSTTQIQIFSLPYFCCTFQKHFAREGSTEVREHFQTWDAVTPLPVKSQTNAESASQLLSHFQTSVSPN